MKKNVLLPLLLGICVFYMHSLESQLMPVQNQPQSWTDWGRQKLSSAYARVPKIKYWPGLAAGLSGASLLALQGIYGTEKPKNMWSANPIDESLTYIAASPLLAYLIAKANLLYLLAGDNDTSAQIRDDFFGFLLNHNRLKEYAPYLLGSSAALLAAPYLYEKYWQNQPAVQQPVEPFAESNGQ